MYLAQPLIGQLRQNLSALRRNAVVRSVGVLMGGTAFAQALAVLVLPLLTRLYTPEDFSLLAIYSSMLGILAAVACLRLEIAIPIPESEKDAANLLALALLSAAALGLLCALVLLSYGTWFTSLIRQPDFQPYLWLIPLSMWLSGSYAALQYWLTRKRRFPVIARTRVTRALGGASVQTVFGIVCGGPFGLLIGHAVGSSAGIASFLRSVTQHDRAAFRTIGSRHMRQVLRRYERFPRFATLEALANTGGAQLPILLIAAFAAGPEAGFLLLAIRVMAAPMGLIGNSVAQVYLSRAPDEMRAGSLPTFTVTMIGGLARIGVGPILFAGIVAPFVFPLVFGEQWKRAGSMVTYMTPWFIMQFVTSPVSMVLHVLNRQATAFMLQVAGFVIRLGAVAIAAIAAQATIVEVYAAAGFIFYLLYFRIVAQVAELGIGALYNELKRASLHVLFWLLAACIVIAIVSILRFQ